MKMLEITYSHDPGDDEKRIVAGIKRGLKAASIYWRMNFAQKHFTAGGAREYGYQRRTEKYLKRKQRVKGHQDPLVWSGTLRQMVLGQFPQPRVKDDGAKLTSCMVLQVPQYTFYTKTKSGSASPPKYDELVTTSAAEAAVLQDIISAGIDEAMGAPGRPKTVSAA